LSVIAFGTLVVPLGVLEKLTDDGDTVSFGEVWASEGDEIVARSIREMQKLFGLNLII
jgi:hypothetical protein